MTSDAVNSNTVQAAEPQGGPELQVSYRLGDRVFIWVGARLMFTALWLLGRSWRLKVGACDSLTTIRKPFILVFWHGDQIAIPWFYGKLGGSSGLGRIFILVSAHRDGQVGAEAVKLSGIESVAGSSSRGGRAALKALHQRIAAGHNVAITPDGPKGPLHKVKAGAVRLAQLSGAPIVCLGLSTDRCWRFRSWDKMLLPKPFASISIHTAEPIVVNSTLGPDEFESISRQVEDTLSRAHLKAAQNSLASVKSGAI